MKNTETKSANKNLTMLPIFSHTSDLLLLLLGNVLNLLNSNTFFHQFTLDERWRFFSLHVSLRGDSLLRRAPKCS